MQVAVFKGPKDASERFLMAATANAHDLSVASKDTGHDEVPGPEVIHV